MRRRDVSLARLRHAGMSELSPLSGVKRKSYFRAAKTVFDPEQTFGPSPRPVVLRCTGGHQADGVLQ